jgi:hypothetical protein
MIHENEKVKADSLAPSPDVTEADAARPFRIIELEPLVRMKFTFYQLKDRVHVLDMIDVGLIDNTWPNRFPSELASRLQAMLDNPDAQCTVRVRPERARSRVSVELADGR